MICNKSALSRASALDDVSSDEGGDTPLTKSLTIELLSEKCWLRNQQKDNPPQHNSAAWPRWMGQ